jgi:hypothetical protein
MTQRPTDRNQNGYESQNGSGSVQEPDFDYAARLIAMDAQAAREARANHLRLAVRIAARRQATSWAR